MVKKRLETVLAIGSHPDDIEFGCGGTLCRYNKSGHTIYLLVMTSGSAGGEPKKRMQEQARSAKLLGAKKIFWGEFKDTRLPFYQDVIPRIEEVVAEVNPTTVFIHHGKDTHQDHRHVSVCAVSATRNIEDVFFYEGPTSYDFDPNVYVDIGSCIREKIRCLSCHQSQVMRTNIARQSIVEISQATAIFRGTQCRIPHAEAFKSLECSCDPEKRHHE